MEKSCETCWRGSRGCVREITKKINPNCWEAEEPETLHIFPTQNMQEILKDEEDGDVWQKNLAMRL